MVQSSPDPPTPQTTSLPPERRERLWPAAGSGRSGMEQASEVGRGKSSMPESMAVSTPPTITCPEIVFLTGIRCSSFDSWKIKPVGSGPIFVATGEPWSGHFSSSHVAVDVGQVKVLPWFRQTLADSPAWFNCSLIKVKKVHYSEEMHISKQFELKIHWKNRHYWHTVAPWSSCQPFPFLCCR